MIVELEKMGIHFKPQMLRNHELVDSYDRNRRDKRRVRQQKLDPRLVGMVKKEKKKRKPGYKRKIKQAIQKDRQQKKKLEKRQVRRQQRRRG